MSVTLTEVHVSRAHCRLSSMCPPYDYYLQELRKAGLDPNLPMTPDHLIRIAECLYWTFGKSRWSYISWGLQHLEMVAWGVEQVEMLRFKQAVFARAPSLPSLWHNDCLDIHNGIAEEYKRWKERQCLKNLKSS